MTRSCYRNGIRGLTERYWGQAASAGIIVLLERNLVLMHKQLTRHYSIFEKEEGFLTK
jgi:hypothetical protein